MMLFSVGTRVTCLEWGDGTVIEVSREPEDSHPVKVRFDEGQVICFKRDGAYWYSCIDLEADIKPLN